MSRKWQKYIFQKTAYNYRDSTFSSGYDELECDTVIFLDYPLEVCIEGIKERRGKERTDMPWVESEDEEDVEFIKFIKNFSSQNRPQIMKLLDKYSYKKIIIFRNRDEADKFLKQMEQEY